jgi:hypothetical protein
MAPEEQRLLFAQGQVAITEKDIVKAAKEINAKQAEARRRERLKKYADPYAELPPLPAGDRRSTAQRLPHGETGAVRYELRFGPNEAGVQLPALYRAKEQEAEYRRRLAEVDAARQKAAQLRQEAARLEQ